MSQEYKRGGDESFQFRFKFNVHKALGSMEISDTDQKMLAAVYNVDEADVALELQYARERISFFAEELRKETDLDFLKELPDKKIVFLGDSNTSNRHSYYNIIRTVLSEYPQITTIDRAISAQKAIDLFTAVYPATVDLHADIAHIMIGTNDVRRIDDRRDVFFTSPQEFEKNVEYIVSSLTKEGTKVILTTIPPISGIKTQIQYAGYHTVYLEEDRLLFNESLMRIAEKHGAILNQLDPVYAPYTAEELTLDDGLHLNDLGNTLLAKVLLQAILSAMQA